MRILQKLSIVMIAFGAILSSNANLLTITEDEINNYLATKLNKKVPLEDKVGIPNLFELHYNLHSLKTQIGRTDEKKAAISGIIDGTLKTKGKKYNATITLDMDAEPYYDAEQGALFLKDMRLLSWSAQPNKYQSELQMFLPMLAEGLSYFLNSTPIYSLDDNKMQEALIKKFGKSLLIEEGIIKLETSIF